MASLASRFIRSWLPCTSNCAWVQGGQGRGVSGRQARGVSGGLGGQAGAGMRGAGRLLQAGQQRLAAWHA